MRSPAASTLRYLELKTGYADEKLGRGYVVSDEIVDTDIGRFHELANDPL